MKQPSGTLQNMRYLAVHEKYVIVMFFNSQGRIDMVSSNKIYCAIPGAPGRDDPRKPTSSPERGCDMPSYCMYYVCMSLLNDVPSRRYLD